MMPDRPVSVRHACLSDAERIAELNVRLAWETERLRLNPQVVLNGVRAVISDATKGWYLVADAGELVIGQIMLTFEWSDWQNAMRWWIQSVYVDVDWRRQGVFAALLTRVVSEARAEGVCAIRLYVAHENESALAVYGRLGFRRSGHLVMENEL